MKLNYLTAHEILDLIKENKTSAQKVYKSVLDQIDNSEKAIKAYANLAERSEISIDENKPFPIPIAVKDNMCVLDQETTCSSNILKGFKPSYDATVIEKLKDSGAIIIGHANMDEFAFGSSTETSDYGPTKNPAITSRISRGRGGGNRTRVTGFGDRCPTIERRPSVLVCAKILHGPTLGVNRRIMRPRSESSVPSQKRKPPRGGLLTWSPCVRYAIGTTCRTF